MFKELHDWYGQVRPGPEVVPWVLGMLAPNMLRRSLFHSESHTFAGPLSRFAEPQCLFARIHRPLIPMPYRSEAEMKKSPEVAWEGAAANRADRTKGFTARTMNGFVERWDERCSHQTMELVDHESS